jgi:hypothetical protein
MFLGLISDDNGLMVGFHIPGRMVVNHRNPTQNRVAAKIPASQGYLISVLHFTRDIRSLPFYGYASYQTEHTP